MIKLLHFWPQILKIWSCFTCLEMGKLGIQRSRISTQINGSGYFTLLKRGIEKGLGMTWENTFKTVVLKVNEGSCAPLKAALWCLLSHSKWTIFTSSSLHLLLMCLKLCASWWGPPESEQFVNTLKLFKMHTMCAQNVFIYQISSQIRHYSKDQNGARTRVSTHSVVKLNSPISQRLGIKNKIDTNY